MSDKPTFDFDALIPNFEKRTVKLGGRIFDVTSVPLGVGVVFTKAKLSSVYDFTDAIVDGTLIMLNQALPKDEWVDRAWLNSVVPGTVFGEVTDQILAPFYESRAKKVMTPEVSDQKKQ